MAKVIFVDDDAGIVITQWHRGLREEADNHEMEIISKFNSPFEIVQQIIAENPDIVFMDYELGKNFTGSQIVTSLRESGFKKIIAANSGDGLSNFEKDGVAHLINDSVSAKDPEGLKEIWQRLMK